MHTQRGNAGAAVLTIAIGIVLILFVMGWFKTDRTFMDTYNLKALLRLPCGLTIEHPNFGRGERTQFPLHVSGYANNCGWTYANGSAGTAQVLDEMGRPLTNAARLAVPGTSADRAPYYFEIYMKLLTPPTTEKGQLILTSNTGLVYAVPLKF